MTNEIQKLSADIAAASNVYYNGASHGLVISDAKFDQMVDRLRELDPENEFFSTVGAAPVDGKKVTHVTKMLSLDKCTTAAEVNKFVKSVGICGSFTIQPKLDGSAIELVYKGGKMVTASTRGNGAVGNDIAANVQAIPSIPKTLPHGVEDLTVRGEVLLSFEDFAAIGGTNPRNVGNGILVRTENENRERLTFVAYGVDFDGSYSASMNLLKTAGFLVPLTVITTASHLQEAIERMGQMRGDSAYPSDGVVVQVDDGEARKELGVGQKHPNYAFAYKWVTESADTVVKDCIFSVGHTGNIIPALQLEPVQLNGTTVSNVLVNNFDYVAKLGVAVGDTVRMIKAGEIIPKCTGVIKRAETIYRCPDCGFTGTAAEQTSHHST